MTTHLDEITVYLHENRMEIKSKSSNRSIIVFDLDLEEPLLSEIKTCKEFWICYKRDVSFSDGQINQINESRFVKVFPKLETIDEFFCSVQPSDVLKFLKDSQAKVLELLDFMDIAIAETEKSNLTSFVLNYTSGFVEMKGINFPHIWLWEYDKARGDRHCLNNMSHSDLIEYFNKILDDGVPTCDWDGQVTLATENGKNLDYFNMIWTEMAKRGLVRIEAQRIDDEQIFDLELEMTENRKLFVKIQGNEVTVSNNKC